MINVSNEFKNLMKYNTDFREYAEVTLEDGTTFILDEDNFTASNNSIVDGAGISNFPLGVAVQKVLQIEILNDHERYKDYIFTGATIRMYLTFQLSNTTERVEKGVYTVISPETYGETIIITAYDDMYKADTEYYTDLVFPQSAGAVLRDACENCGISLYSSDFMHNDFVITTKPVGKYREIIGYIAMIACGNARIDNAGFLRIQSYEFGSVYTELEDFINLKVEVNDTVITGVKMTVDEEEETEVFEGTDEYVLSLKNPLAAGKEQTLVSFVYEAVAGIPFRTFTGDYISNPLLEFMDLVEIVDRGNTYKSFLTDVNFVFAGITSIKNATPGPLRQRSVYNSGSAKVEQLARDLVKKERNSREEAIKKLNENIEKSSGMYTTEVEQPDGSNITYLHDKPTLEESKNVIVITSNAVGLSTDGGETYPFGFQIDGDMLAKILSAEGVSADWINTGALVIKNADGKVIFSADISTGKVVISGDSVFIGAKTLSDELSDIQENIKKSASLIMQMDNEYQGIPTDSKGNYERFPDNVKTTVTVWNGDQDVTSECIYSVNKSESVIGTWDNANKTYTVNGLNEDTGWIDITATFVSTLTVTKRMIVSKIKGGEDGRSYYLKASNTIVKVQSNGLVEPGTLEYSAFYRDGQSTELKEYYGIFVIEETLDNTNWNIVYESKQPESKTTYIISAALANVDGRLLINVDGNHLEYSRNFTRARCTLYASDKSTVIDTSVAEVFYDVQSLNHEDIFTLLTKDGAVKGIYKEGDQIYISFTYAKGGELTLGGVNNGNGFLKILDSSGKQVGYINNTGVHFNQGSFEGTITSGNGNIAGWTITKESINSINNLIKLFASGAIVMDNNGYLQIGNTKLTNSSHALKVDGGLWIYNGTDQFSDGTDQMRIYNLQHVGSGGYLVFGSDGATVCYSASSSKRYKDISEPLTKQDVERAFDVDVMWAKYKEGYLLESDPMCGKYVPMLIAEDIEEKIPSAAVYRNGQIEDWNHRVIIPVMMKMIQNLKAEIEELKRGDKE